MTEQETLAWQLLSNFFSIQIETTPPRFPLGVRVDSVWIDECGQLRRDKGVIVGIFPAPPRWRPGWWYVVRFYELVAQDWVILPIEEDCHEGELELTQMDV